MSASPEFLLSRPAIDRFLDELKEQLQVFSVFLKPKPMVFSPTELLSLTAVKSMCADLGEIDSDFSNCVVLNRLEFEGSLVSVLLRGGCHGRSEPMAESEARQVVRSALDAAFPQPFDDLAAFRIDDTGWCKLVSDSTIASCYVVCQGPRGLWWILCATDFD